MYWHPPALLATFRACPRRFFVKFVRMIMYMNVNLGYVAYDISYLTHDIKYFEYNTIYSNI